MIGIAHREVERKYELPEGAEAWVDWSALEGYTVAGGSVEHRLQAVYYDTADMSLHRHHVALRRRRGGSDDGWHVKLRENSGRYEAQFPLLAGSPGRMPAVVRHLVEGLSAGQSLHPIAMLGTTRRVLSVADDAGAQVAEVAVDDVKAVDHRTRTQRAWSEWEVELVDGAAPDDHQHRIFTAVEQVLFAAGARPSTSEAKLARALGADDGTPPEADDVPVPATRATATTSGKKGAKAAKRQLAQRGRRKASGAELLLTVLGQLADQLVLWDLKVRLDVPDAVHQMRVTSRSMRSLLKAAAPFFDGETAQELDVRLRELARALSGARDAEVTAELLPSRVDALGGRVDPVTARALQDSAEQQAEAAAATARGNLSTRQHLQLLGDLQAFAADPPLSARCYGLSARKVADRLLRRALRKVVRVGAPVARAEDSGADIDPEHRLEHLHEVRKAVKRVRYVDATLNRSGFQPGTAMGHAAADAKKHQDVLGEIMDAGVVAGWLERTAASSKDSGEDRYAVGLLHGAELAAVRIGEETGHEVVAELLAQLRQDLS